MELGPVRRNTPAPCGHETDRLKARHAMIVRLHTMGWTTKDIATEMGVHSSTVRNALRSDVGRRREGVLQVAADQAAVDIQKELRGLAPRALRALEDVLCEDSEATLALRMKAAESVLDRLGHGKVTRSEVNMRHGRLAEVGEDALARAAMQAGVLPAPAPTSAAETIDLVPVGA